MLELRNCTVGYNGKPLLQNVNLNIPAGKLVMLLGVNGCGKTTLLKTIVGLLPPLEGKILLDGKPKNDYSPRQWACKVAYMAQNRNAPAVTAQRFVLHGRFPHLGYPRRYTAADTRIAAQALEQAGAKELAHQNLQTLSGGQQQRVYLAMALAQDTPLVLMDEPTAFLDIGHQLSLLQTCRKLTAQGKTVVMVLHDLRLALEQADLVSLCHNGTATPLMTPEELWKKNLLSAAFGVEMQRQQTEHGWQYYYRTV